LKKLVKASVFINKNYLINKYAYFKIMQKAKNNKFVLISLALLMSVFVLTGCSKVSLTGTTSNGAPTDGGTPPTDGGTPPEGMTPPTDGGTAGAPAGATVN